MNRRVLDDFCEYLVDLVHARVAPDRVSRRIACRAGPRVAPGVAPDRAGRRIACRAGRRAGSR
ncbi:MAG TPA: hypothetical protein PKD61_24565, partial [Polyangiaceae bacterium]|nr:hypothetical protein [Polyangiaceae bacterium]